MDDRQGGWYVCDYCSNNRLDTSRGTCLCGALYPARELHKRVAIDDDRPYHSCLWFSLAKVFRESFKHDRVCHGTRAKSVPGSARYGKRT